MFDRHGKRLCYDTEEAMIAILEGHDIDLNNMPSMFKQATMVDAASHGWNRAIDLMMDMGFSANGTDHKNYTPLGYAAMKGQTVTVKKLIDEYDADIMGRNNAGPSMFDAEFDPIEWFEGYTALELALQHEQYETALVLNDSERWQDYFYIDVWTDCVMSELGMQREAILIEAANGFDETAISVDYRIIVLAVEKGYYAAVKRIFDLYEYDLYDWIEYPIDDRARLAFRITQDDIDAAEEVEGEIGPYLSEWLFQRGLMQLMKESGKRHWLRARQAVRNRWLRKTIVLHWQEQVAQNQTFERDRQEAVATGMGAVSAFVNESLS